MSTEVDEKVKIYRLLEEERQNLIAKKQVLLSQYNENILVKDELDLLSDPTPVFKLVGPVLMAVELEESKGNVSKRLEFIEGEMKKVDDQIEAKRNELSTIGEEVSTIQRRMQAEALQAVQQITDAANT